MFTEKDAVNEIREYLRTPEHKRDRQTFQREQFSKARQTLTASVSDEEMAVSA